MRKLAVLQIQIDTGKSFEDAASNPDEIKVQFVVGEIVKHW